MRNLIFTVLVLILCTNAAIAQFALRDAEFLAPLFTDQGAFVALNETLPNSSTKAQEVFQKYNSNPALPVNPFISSNLAPQSNPQAFMELQKRNAENKAMMMTGPPVNNPFSANVFAQGLAIWLANRAKEELAAAFFRDFQEQIQKNEFANELFPASVATLKLVGEDEFYQLSQYIASLRENFRSDLAMLPSSLENTIRDKDTLLIKKPETQILALDGLHLVQFLLDGENPLAFLEYLSSPWSSIQDTTQLSRIADPIVRDHFLTVAALLRTSNVLQESLRKSDTEAAWYTPAEIMEKLRDPVIAKLYFGLLWERAAGLNYGSGRSLRNLLETTRVQAHLLHELQRDLLDFSADLNKNISELKSLITTVPDSLANERFFHYYNSSIRLLKLGFHWYRSGWPNQNTDEIDKVMQRFFAIADGISQLHLQLRMKNYPAAVATTMRLLSRLDVDNKALATFFRYANFMATVAQAHTPEEVAEAIEAFALPPGSSRVKKTPKQRAFAVNAYTGLSGGGEWQANRDELKGFGAISAPIGLSYTVGTKKGRYFGVFVPIIDVGALTALRFSDSLSYDLPSLKWGNLVSPGLYLVFGSKQKNPLTFGLGGQFGPSLRKVEIQSGQGNLIQELGGWRFGAFLSVDIPVTYMYLGKQ